MMDGMWMKMKVKLEIKTPWFGFCLIRQVGAWGGDDLATDDVAMAIL